VRLSNPKARGLNQTNRTENEVSAIWLTRQSLSQNLPGNNHLADAIPVVYAWSAFETVPDRPDIGFGWLVMDFKPGVALNEHFSTFSLADKTDILGQFADLFAGVQRAPIPASLGTLHCGMAIDNATGDIVPGQMSILAGGPWDGLVELWRARFREELGGADGSEIIAGWRANGVRDAVEEFMSSGLEKFLVDAGVDMNARALIHGDFSRYSPLQSFLPHQNVESIKSAESVFASPSTSIPRNTNSQQRRGTRSSTCKPKRSQALSTSTLPTSPTQASSF
jgi:hypothetical protein